jgi:hypothetical protein
MPEVASTPAQVAAGERGVAVGVSMALPVGRAERHSVSRALPLDMPHATPLAAAPPAPRLTTSGLPTPRPACEAAARSYVGASLAALRAAPARPPGPAGRYATRHSAGGAARSEAHYKRATDPGTSLRSGNPFVRWCFARRTSGSASSASGLGCQPRSGRRPLRGSLQAGYRPRDQLAKRQPVRTFANAGHR